MITLDQYFGSKPHSAGQEAEAVTLLGRVNGLLDEAKAVGVYPEAVDVDTGSQISGSKDGHGDGGFRTPDAKTGAPKSAHKEGKAVDVFDSLNSLDNWLTDAILSRHGLYREAPEKTVGWCHLQTKPPRSNRRTFYP